jgi:hypothetical protein
VNHALPACRLRSVGLFRVDRRSGAGATDLSEKRILGSSRQAGPCRHDTRGGRTAASALFAWLKGRPGIPSTPAEPRSGRAARRGMRTMSPRVGTSARVSTTPESPAMPMARRSREARCIPPTACSVPSSSSGIRTNANRRASIPISGLGWPGGRRRPRVFFQRAHSVIYVPSGQVRTLRWPKLPLTLSCQNRRSTLSRGTFGPFR